MDRWRCLKTISGFFRQYDEVRARVLIYDKHLEELETLYKEKENEDISPTIVEEEDEDGKIIDI